MKFRDLQAISRPMTWHKFGSPDLDETDEDAGSYFISAVCWKSDSPTMLAANSQGTIKVLVLASWVVKSFLKKMELQLKEIWKKKMKNQNGNWFFYSFFWSAFFYSWTLNYCSVHYYLSMSIIWNQEKEGKNCRGTFLSSFFPPPPYVDCKCAWDRVRFNANDGAKWVMDPKGERKGGVGCSSSLEILSLVIFEII